MWGGGNRERGERERDFFFSEETYLERNSGNIEYLPLRRVHMACAFIQKPQCISCTKCVFEFLHVLTFT